MELYEHMTSKYLITSLLGEISLASYGYSTRVCGTRANWRASEASETLSGVTQSRFRYIYWRASEARETLIGLNNGNQRYI